MDIHEFLIMQAIHAGIGYIMLTIKNPASDRAKLLKDSLLTLAADIQMAYAATGQVGQGPPQL